MEDKTFADPRLISRWTRGLWIALAVVHAVQQFSYLLQYRFVLDARSGAYGSNEVLMRAARENDLRQGVIAIAVIVLLIAGVVMMFRWIHRAMYNVIALGAAGTISPAWAVGWFFVPFANFVMPYIAMSQIWRGSVSAREWDRQRTSFLVPLWWLLWIVVGIFSFVIVHLSRNVHSLDALRTVTSAGLVYSALQFIRDVLVAVLVRRVTEMQVRQHTQLSRPQAAISPS